jgi:hypothetical protein
MDNSTIATPFQWDDEKIAHAIFQKQCGLSASQIAESLGTTKGSVLGKFRRMGLSKPLVRRYEDVSNKVPPAQKKGKAYVARKREVLAQNGNPHLPPGSVPLLDLRADNCRWPVTERPPHLFCGRPKWGGSPYCACHTAKAWRSQGGAS